MEKAREIYKRFFCVEKMQKLAHAVQIMKVITGDSDQLIVMKQKAEEEENTSDLCLLYHVLP